MFIECTFTLHELCIFWTAPKTKKLQFHDRLQQIPMQRILESISWFSLNSKIQPGLQQLPMLYLCAMVVSGSEIAQGWARPQDLLELWHETKKGAKVQQSCCWEAWLQE